MGRPLKKIDPDLVAKLAGINCTEEEIAATVGCSRHTLVKRFLPIIEQGRLNGRSSLKRKMWECAMGYKSTKIVMKKIKLEEKKPDGTIQKREETIPTEVTVSVEPNSGMQQWLSKNMLGYSEKVETKNETTLGTITAEEADTEATKIMERLSQRGLFSRPKEGETA